MEKIYGYKEKDVIGLAEFLKDRGAEPLSSIFTKYALINGKAKGTVRNLYYAVAKRSKVDKEFCDKYLGGKPLQINDIAEFDADEEKKLVKQILVERQSGKSVRSVIMRLSNGDAKLALRYQNKFRNLIKNKPDFISEIVSEIKAEGKGELSIEINKPNKSFITEQQFNRLKVEIDSLIGRISSNIKKENQYLKERIGVLETENLRLTALLYARDNTTAKKYFKPNKPKEFIN